MRIRNSRPQFPFQYPSVELNAPRSSSLAKAIRGPLMEYLKSPGLLRPAVADAEGQNSGRDSMPEIQKLGSERHHTTGKRGRPAKNSRVHKRQNCSPQCSRPIVLALSAVPPSGARKRVSKKSAHVASAPSRSLGAQEPANPVWKGAPPVEVKSNEPTFSGSVIDSAKDGVEEDVKLFLELVHSLQSSVAKGKEGKAKETEQLAG